MSRVEMYTLHELYAARKKPYVQAIVQMCMKCHPMAHLFLEAQGVRAWLELHMKRRSFFAVAVRRNVTAHGHGIEVMAVLWGTQSFVRQRDELPYAKIDVISVYAPVSQATAEWVMEEMAYRFMCSTLQAQVQLQRLNSPNHIIRTNGSASNSMKLYRLDGTKFVTVPMQK